jgi:hypothetical protein
VENSSLSRTDLNPSLPVPLGGRLWPPPWQSLLGNWIMIESPSAGDGAGKDKIKLPRHQVENGDRLPGTPRDPGLGNPLIVSPRCPHLDLR